MGPVTVFVDPGKYDYVTCDQLINLHKQWAERELELKVLMDKAEQSRALAASLSTSWPIKLITRWPMKNSR
jgi:hypothetical protein